MTQGVVIVGAGHAGFQVAASLRQSGYKDRVALINDEAHLPYQRPPLSKAYLKGTGGPDSLMFRPQKFFADQTIELMSDHAVAIDRAARKLKLASGAALDYGHLVLATGARNRLLDLPNAALPNVRYLRILDDSEDLRARIAACKRVVVIGAGFIGLEFAATARIKGLRSRRARACQPRDGARGHRGSLRLFPEASCRSRRAHPSRRDGDRDRGRRRQGHRRQPQRRPAYPGRPRRGRRRRHPECRACEGCGSSDRVGHHRQRSSAHGRSEYFGDRRLRAVRQPALRRHACGWNPCRTPPIRRSASRRG